jgi:hypothetical protein
MFLVGCQRCEEPRRETRTSRETSAGLLFNFWCYHNHLLCYCSTIQAWDTLRVKHSDALDNILESLAAQLVPPDFHQSNSTDSSLFGSQHSDEAAEVGGDGERPKSSARSLSVSHSPSSTLRNGLQIGNPTARRTEGMGRQTDRGLWKTLRDFVDEQGIEDVLETIENDRLGLDVSAVPLGLMRWLNTIHKEYLEQDGRVSRDTLKDYILHPELVT